MCYVQKLPMTKVVDALMEVKSKPEVDDYRYFDPKLLRTVDRYRIVIYEYCLALREMLSFNSVSFELL